MKKLTTIIGNGGRRLCRFSAVSTAYELVSMAVVGMVPLAILGTLMTLPLLAQTNGTSASSASATARGGLPRPDLCIVFSTVDTPYTTQFIKDCMEQAGLGPVEIVQVLKGIKVRSRAYRDLAELGQALVEIRRTLPTARIVDTGSPAQWGGEVFPLPKSADGSIDLEPLRRIQALMRELEGSNEAAHVAYDPESRHICVAVPLLDLARLTAAYTDSDYPI